MKARADPGLRDKVVITNYGTDGFADRCRMNYDIHACLQFHWLVISNARPLNEVISLPMCVEASLREIAFVLKKPIIFIPNILRPSP